MDLVCFTICEFICGHVGFPKPTVSGAGFVCYCSDHVYLSFVINITWLQKLPGEAFERFCPNARNECRDGSRNVEGCWGFLYLKIQKLPNVYFMLFDRCEIHIQDFKEFLTGIFISVRCPSSQNLINNEIPEIKNGT